MRARNPLTGAVVQSVSVSAAEAADPTLYKGVFTDLPAGRYKFTLEDSNGTIKADWYSVLLADGTYSADDDVVNNPQETAAAVVSAIRANSGGEAN